MCGGKPCVAACRQCSPPQPRQPYRRDVENLGIEALVSKHPLHSISSLTNSCLASNTTIRCQHTLAVPPWTTSDVLKIQRMYVRVCQAIQRHVTSVSRAEYHSIMGRSAVVQVCYSTGLA
jgi:hypothetical protein